MLAGLFIDVNAACKYDGAHAVRFHSVLFQLEARLATKEEQALEKELVYDQVCRLTERVSSTVQAGKEGTLTLAKKVVIRNKLHC